MLPKLPNRDQIKKAQTITFSGINRNPGAPDGSIYNTVNMDTDRAPCLAPRRRRKIIRYTEGKVNGMLPYDGLIWVEGENVFHNGEIIGTVTDGKKQLATMNGWLIVFPDKVMISLDPERRQEPDGGIVPMENEHEVTVYFKDGTYAGVPADGNEIQINWRTSTTDWTEMGFRAGDTIVISGAENPDNNRYATIQEVVHQRIKFGGIGTLGYDGDFTLRFTPFTFFPNEEDPTAETITVKLVVPDLDRIFVHENRLWGYKGNTIYCSALGSPTSFSRVDAISTDAWAVDLDGPGEITGAIVYQGYPTFFKEDRVIRIYGDYPSQFRFMETSTLGVMKGCADSLAVAGDTLYYLGPKGMTAFNGGYARNIHEPFGDLKFASAHAVSDGIRYYVYFRIGGNREGTWVYDTKWDSWYRWDYENDDLMEADAGVVYMMDNSRGQILIDGRATVPSWVKTWKEEEQFGSMVEFGSFTGNYWTSGRGYGNPSRKGTSKLLLRLTLITGKLTVFIRFDGGGDVVVADLEATNGRMRSFDLPIIPRRSDNYRIELQGTGDWTLHSLVREEYSGSDIH